MPELLACPRVLPLVLESFWSRTLLNNSSANLIIVCNQARMFLGSVASEPPLQSIENVFEAIINIMNVMAFAGV